MSMIEKEYFTLAEVVEALGMPWTDVIYLAENGHLRLSVLVFRLPVQCGFCEQIAEAIGITSPMRTPPILQGSWISGIRMHT